MMIMKLMDRKIGMRVDGDTGWWIEMKLMMIMMIDRVAASIDYLIVITPITIIIMVVIG